MLEKTLARLFNGTKEIRLSPNEKLQIGNSVQDFCLKHSVREEEVLRPITVMTHDPFIACRAEELSTQEKARAWQRIQTHMHSSPMHEQQYTLFELLSSYFFQHQFIAGALAVFLLISAGTGISYAAENALPSDFLYFFKVNISEPLTEALTRDPSAKAEVQMKHLQRRTTEVQILAGKKELEESDTVKLEQSIDVFMDRIEAKIAELDRNDPSSEQLIRQYRHVLTMQESALQALQNEHITAQRIEQILQQVKSARQRFESSSSSVHSVFTKEVDNTARTQTNTSVTNSVKVEQNTDVSDDASMHIDTNTTTKVHVETNTESNSEVHVDSESSVSGHSEVETESASSIIDEVNEKIERQKDEMRDNIDLNF